MREHDGKERIDTNKNCLVCMVMIMIICLLFCSCSSVKDKYTEQSTTSASVSSETDEKGNWEGDAKLPVEYTWEEFLQLSEEQRQLFIDWFESLDDFELWQSQANATYIDERSPWDEDGKDPSDYTWEEFLALSDENQERFFEWFNSSDAFEKWRERVTTSRETEIPPWLDDTKLPSEYTWEEFLALSDENQERFFEWFDSSDAFTQWKSQATNNADLECMPWENDGKLPQEYTWEEFLALNNAQQEQFFEWFETPEEFEQWQDRAALHQGADSLPWEEGGKLPSNYTWDEFQAMSDADQEKFFEWFTTPEEFEEWYRQACLNENSN